MECASSVVATLLEGHALGGRALRSDSSRFTRWRRACFLRLIETYSLWTSTGTCHSTRQLLPLGKRLNSCLLHPLKLRRLLPHATPAHSRRGSASRSPPPPPPPCEAAAFSIYKRAFGMARRRSGAIKWHRRLARVVPAEFVAELWHHRYAAAADQNPCSLLPATDALRPQPCGSYGGCN